MIGRRAGSRHAHAGVLDHNIAKTLFIQMVAQRCLKGIRVGIHRVADMAGGARIGCHRIHRRIRLAGEHGEHNKAIPTIDLLSRCQAGLAPIGVYRGSTFAAAHRAAIQHAAHFGRHTILRQPITHQDFAARINNGANGVAHANGGVRGQPTPMAGMHAPLAQLQHQIKLENPTRAGGDCRHFGFNARPV